MSSPSPAPAVTDPVALARERSMLWAGLTDLVMILVVVATGLWANSMMMIAEAIRGTLLLALEMVLLVLLRRIYRRQVAAFDYGAGKLEQFANLGIGTAMGLAGLWIAGSAVYRWYNPPLQQSVGLVFAAVVGGVNVVQNGMAFWALWRAGRDGTSLIILGQMRSRLAKLISSALVLVALAVNAAAGDGPVGLLAEALGTGFVALVMLELAVSMWRSALPSLLDRTLEEEQQRHINRALVTHFDDYDDLISVRSRLSGNMPLVEVVLGFAAHRQIGEIQGVVDRIVADVRELIPGSAVTVTPVAVGRAA